MKQLFVFLVLCFSLLSTVKTVGAVEKESGKAATLSSFAPLLVDHRVLHLQAFLREYNSPLEKNAVTFIREADKHNLDWRLVVAIAGTESTFGKHIPPGSYNAWGWGIPTGSQYGIGFRNWDDGIQTVTQGLKYRYFNRGATSLDQIGRIYAASPTWSSKVGYFLDRITNFIPKSADVLLVSI